MSPEMLTTPDRRAIDHLATGDYLDVEVRHIMTPGVVTIAEDATLRQAHRAITAHRIHAILVLGRTGGTPLGWVTARGLLNWLTQDESLACAKDAITHPPATIQPSATAREALTALEQPGISQLIVASHPGTFPEGVLSDVDMVAFAAR
jgi:CBS domain-containing protein